MSISLFAFRVFKRLPPCGSASKTCMLSSATPRASSRPICLNRFLWMKSQPFSAFGCCSRPDETSCSNPPVRCLVIVFRSDGCIIREIMLKVKFLFPAASHSSSLLKCLSFWLKQYNKPPRSQERSLEFLPHARVVCPKQQKPKGTYKPRHPSIRKRGMKKHRGSFVCLPRCLNSGEKTKKRTQITFRSARVIWVCFSIFNLFSTYTTAWVCRFFHIGCGFQDILHPENTVNSDTGFYN